MTHTQPASAVNTADPPVGGRLIEITALKRTAHHAFIEWLCQHKASPTLFINNVYPSLPPRYGRLSVFHPEAIGGDELRAFEAETSRALAQGRYDVMINFEGRSVRNIRALNQSLYRFWGNKQITCMLFLRDPVNNFASLCSRIRTESFNQYSKVYLQVFRFCDYMDEVAAGNGASRCLFDDVILFSAWQRDEGYRRALARRYHLNGTQLSHHVPEYGGGSSFGGIAFNPVADQAKLFSRWREMQDNPLFLSLFLNGRIVRAVRAYYRRYQEHEPVEPKMVDDLCQSALANAGALRLARVWLRGIEQDREIFDDVEREHPDAGRRLLRAYLKSKMTVRRVLFDHFQS